MSAVGAFYYARERAPDLQRGAAFNGGVLEVDRPVEFRPLTAGTIHFAALELAGDAVLVLTGILTTDKPPRPKVVICNRRALEQAKHRRRVRHSRFLGPLYDEAEILGELRIVAEATVGLNGTVISPTAVLGELAMVGEASLGLAGGIVQHGELAMVGDAALAADGSQIFAGELAMVGEAMLLLRGTGGDNASVDPAQRRGGIVSIGVRGGHS